jgi:hypothetical protein
MPWWQKYCNISRHKPAAPRDIFKKNSPRDIFLKNSPRDILKHLDFD